METLRDYVNWGLTHCDKTASAEGVPLILEKCVKNKKMKQLEVYGESVQNGTPTPEAPVEVDSVGQACIRNWFEKNMFLRVEDYNAATNYSFYKAKYIEGLKPNTKYNVVIERLNGTKPMSAKCTVLLSDGVFLPTANNFTTIGHASSKDETNNSPHTSDASGRLTIGIATSTTQEQLDSLWENTNVYLYEDGDETTVYKIPVTVSGKNIFKPTVVSTNTIRTTGLPTLNGTYGTVIDSTDFSDNKVIVKQTPNSDYNTAAYQNGYVYFEIPELVIGKKYRLSFDLNITDNPLNATSLVMYALNNAIGVVYITPNRCEITFTYKTPPTRRKPDVELRCGGASFELSNVMITEEGQDETYEPYVEPQTTNVYLNEPLRKIGDYADVLDFKSKKVVRNTFVRVYDGTQGTDNPFNISDNEFNWEIADANNFWQCTLSDLLPVIPKYEYSDYKQIPICLQLPVKTGVFNSLSSPATVDKELIWYCNSGRNVRLFLSKDRFDGTLMGHRAYLKANPITVYCAIYEPYEEPIDCDLPILPAKTSIVEIDTSVLPSNIKGKYIKR